MTPADVYRAGLVRTFLAQGHARRIREARNISRREVATVCGVTRGAYGAWEDGRREPGTEAALKLYELMALLTGDPELKVKYADALPATRAG